LTTERNDVVLTFTKPLPVFNEVSSTVYESVNDVHADSCKPPHALGANRGSYFSGRDANENIGLQRFELTDTHTIYLWVKAEAGDSSLTSFNADIFHGWSTYYYKYWNITYDLDFEEEKVMHDSHLDFWLTDCDTAVVELGHDRVISPNLARGWTEIGYSIEGLMRGSDVRIY
jgi:hypothetical protein